MAAVPRTANRVRLTAGHQPHCSTTYHPHRSPLIAPLPTAHRAPHRAPRTAHRSPQDRLLQHVHALSQKWLIDVSALHIHRHAVLHDAITLAHTADAAIGPSQLLMCVN